MPQDIASVLPRLKEVCDALSPGVRISTSDLVKRAWPHDAITQRAAFSVLTHPPSALEGYWTRGSPVKGKFGMKRPYLWHALLPICPHCHGTGRVALAMPRETTEDLEIYLAETQRRAGTKLASPEPWTA